MICPWLQPFHMICPRASALPHDLPLASAKGHRIYQKRLQPKLCLAKAYLLLLLSLRLKPKANDYGVLLRYTGFETIWICRWLHNDFAPELSLQPFHMICPGLQPSHMICPWLQPRVIGFIKKVFSQNYCLAKAYLLLLLSLQLKPKANYPDAIMIVINILCSARIFCLP